MFSPFFRYITPTTDLPKKYEPSPPTREISDSEVHEPGREFWNGPQGSIKPGYRSTQSTTCTKEFLAWHPYSVTFRKPATPQSEADSKKERFLCGEALDRWDGEGGWSDRQSNGLINWRSDLQADSPDDEDSDLQANLPVDGGSGSQSGDSVADGSGVQANLPVDDGGDQ